MEGGGLIHDNGVPHLSSKVDYYLNNLLASHLRNSDLTPHELAEASRSNAASAAMAAKAARAIADEKAVGAAKAIAAAKKALDLIFSFPNPPVFVQRDEESPLSRMQLVEVSQSMIPNSSSFEHRNDQGERLSSELAISDGLGMELVPANQNESAVEEAAKEAVQVTRKRGRPKSK